MTTLTEKRHAGSFIISEQENFGSRDEITVTNLNGNTTMSLEAGQVLGLIGGADGDTKTNTDSLGAVGDYVPYNSGQTDGSQVAAGILFGELVLVAGATAKATNFVRLGQVRKSDLTDLDNDAIEALSAAPYLITFRDGLTEIDTYIEAND